MPFGDAIDSLDAGELGGLGEGAQARLFLGLDGLEGDDFDVRVGSEERCLRQGGARQAGAVECDQNASIHQVLLLSMLGNGHLGDQGPKSSGWGPVGLSWRLALGTAGWHGGASTGACDVVRYTGVSLSL